MNGLIRPILNHFRRMAGTETPREELRRLGYEWDRLREAIRQLRASGWDGPADDETVRASEIARQIRTLQDRLRRETVRGPGGGDLDPERGDA